MNSMGLVAQLCFTGVAQIGMLKTREWISQIIAQATQPIDIDLIASEIAIRGTTAVKTLPADRKMLTVVVAIVEHGKRPRLVIVSNMDRFDGPRRTQPLDKLEVSSIVPTKPMLRVFGYDAGLSHVNRRYLMRLLRDDSDVNTIKEALASVNKRTAQSPNSRGLVSEECMVSSLLFDGSSSTINFGEVKGIPDNFMGNMNVGEFVKTHFKAAPGKHPAFVQSASVSQASTQGAPELLPEGEPRILRFSTPTSTMTGIGNTFGGKFDKLTIGGLSDSIAIRKNEWVSAIINTINLEMGQTTREESGFRLFPGLELENLPTVEGAQPRNWNYTFDVTIEKMVHTLSVRKMSMAFRSVNCTQPLPILGPTEELVMMAPRDGLTLSADVKEGLITGTIEASFLLRDFPELGPAVTSQSISITLPKGEQTKKIVPIKTSTKVGRNELCPCGSGKKYKRCHG